MSRTPVEASDIKKVFVLDWDDCLRDERGLNYQLMHNALEIAARENSKKLPALAKAVSSLQSRMRKGESAGNGDPLVMKSQQDFSDYVMANPGLWSSHIVQDFVRKMLPELDSVAAESIAHTIHAQFSREYHRMMRPQPDDELGDARQDSLPRDVPFPDTEFSMLPGAHERLNNCRTEDSRVLLISNRADGHLKKEVDHLGLGHFFDVVSGTPRVSVTKDDAKLGPMPEALRKRLTQALTSGDDEVLRKALEDASEFAHPDTTEVKHIQVKPDPTRLKESLESLAVPPDVPIISYGDQPSDVKQLAEFAAQGRRVEGVIVNPKSKDVGTQIDISGVPTRVVRDLNEA